MNYSQTFVEIYAIPSACFKSLITYENSFSKFLHRYEIFTFYRKPERFLIFTKKWWLKYRSIESNLV